MIEDHGGEGRTDALWWHGPLQDVRFSGREIDELLRARELRLYVVRHEGRFGVAARGRISTDQGDRSMACTGIVPPVGPERLGSAGFRACHGTRYAYMAGGMAQGIASTEMVIALGKGGMLGSFGAGGMDLQRIEGAIRDLQAALPGGPFAVNLLSNPADPGLERGTVELLLRLGARAVEAAAYIKVSPALVLYRLRGLSRGQGGGVAAANKVIAKISRREVAEVFLRPAPLEIARSLREQGLVTDEQVGLSQEIALADDITVEADSGGHTDNMALVCLLPSILAVRDQVAEQTPCAADVRVGAGGGISTPVSALGAFVMGAAYVVTGSVNQTSVEAGTSTAVKKLLSRAEMSDVVNAPSADMFELGAQVQVLKKGTMFPFHAARMYELYKAYDSIERLPPAEREKLEKRVFRRSIDEVWSETVAFLRERAPHQLELAEADPKQRMALIFRWYLGQSSKWARAGVPERAMDYQIWCGPSIGSFNAWIRGTGLEPLEDRRVADIGRAIMEGAADCYRARLFSLARMPGPQGLGDPGRVSPCEA